MLYMVGLSVLMHHFTRSLYASTKIHIMSMLVSLSYAPLVLLATHVLVEFSVDTNALAQTHT